MSTWRKVSDGLPESGVPVLVYVVSPTNPKWSRRLRAEYAARFTLETGGDEEGEYSEEKDNYYCHEGWYESNEEEEIHWHIGDNVTHWMPLPDPPND